MSIEEQRRAMVLTRVVAGSLSTAEAATLLRLSERSVWRLKRRFLADGPAGLVHGNRGRPPARRLDDTMRARIVELAGGRFEGANDCHLVDLLAEEGLVVSRATVQRILRTAGRPSPRHRRPPRHRSRRDRMPQAGLLLQLDGSRHDWLESRGPRLTLVGAIDDATGILTGATFREQEDVAGYLEILRDTVRRHGVPTAVYHDRHTIFVASTRTPLTLEEQLVNRRTPTQFGRALAELGISSIAAWTPQAKGRIERVWGTLQDRLVTELRLAAATDRASANKVLRRFVPRFNRRFAVPCRTKCPAHAVEIAWSLVAVTVDEQGSRPVDRALEAGLHVALDSSPGGRIGGVRLEGLEVDTELLRQPTHVGGLRSGSGGRIRTYD